MARAYPNSTFVGFDSHAPSIERARQAAAEAGVSGNTSFAVAAASEFGAPLTGYDLVAFFDCLHDMGNPTAALRRAAQTLAADGSVLLVEPMAGETDSENLNPVGRVYSGASVLVCSPHAIAESGTALGTIATVTELRAVAAAAGLSQFRLATATPFNRIFEARP
jgi:2-polyprenyl-3-methyl-5-hydroxy-6-metoxy-1,4-benzoquinol methylase